MFKKIAGAALGLALVLSPITPASAESVSEAPQSALWGSGVVLNPGGGAGEGDGLYTLFDRGTFVTYRNNQVQNYLDYNDEYGGEAQYNGILLAWNGVVYASPMYANALDNEFVTVGTETLKAVELDCGNVNCMGQSGDGYVVSTQLYTDLDDDNVFDSNELSIFMSVNYFAPQEYFYVTYGITANFVNNNPVQLYHGIDMYLDGNDDGPAATGVGIGDFTGRYVLQTNPDTGAVGGFIEKDYSFSSYYADYYNYLPQSNNEYFPAPWTAPNRGPVYGEPLPSTVTDDESEDIGVGIHFDFGAISEASIERNAYVIFASGSPGGDDSLNSEPDPVDGLDILSKGEMAVACGDSSREIIGEVENVTEVLVGGVSVPFTIHSDTRMSIDLTNAPTGIQDLTIVADEGEVNWQRAYDISSCAAVKAWTTFNEATNKVRIYAKNLIGAGKIQFFVDGKEVGWVRPVDASDPKLITNANGVYFVRTVTLDAKEKNRVEIKLNGERLVQNTYVPKD